MSGEKRSTMPSKVELSVETGKCNERTNEGAHNLSGDGRLDHTDVCNLSGDSSSSGVRFNCFENVSRPFIIGVGGGTASGKTTVCGKIMQLLDQGENQQQKVCIIGLDSFYRNLSEDEKVKASSGEFNFDHPDALDESLMLVTLKDIKAGKSVNIPSYDYVNNCQRFDKLITIDPVDVILVEGILVFYKAEMRQLFNMKLFVDTDADTRLSRRVMRDVERRSRSLDAVLRQYSNFVKPAFEEFCLPTKKYADVIIPRGADNTVAIDLIVQHIQDLLRPSARRELPTHRQNSDSSMVFRHLSPPH